MNIQCTFIARTDDFNKELLEEHIDPASVINVCYSEMSKDQWAVFHRTSDSPREIKLEARTIGPGGMILVTPNGRLAYYSADQMKKFEWDVDGKIIFEHVPDQQEYKISAYYRDNHQPYSESATAKTPEAAAALCAWKCAQDNGGCAELTVVEIRDAAGQICGPTGEVLEFEFTDEDPCPVDDNGELLLEFEFTDEDPFPVDDDGELIK